MSLKYNILWVDDRKEDYQTLELDKDIETYVKDLFFEPHIFMYDTVEEAEQKMNGNKYDVIFCDYNIGENKNGKDFIADIRGRNVNAEVLFYSAKQKPPETEYDRISFLKLQNDTAYDDLKNRMKAVIDLTVEKLNDLSNLRGLVMAEVSELDVIMKNIISSYCKQNQENERKLHKYIIDIIEKHVKESLQVTDCNNSCTHVWKSSIIPDIVFKQNFDSYNTARALLFIMKEIKMGPDKFLTNYTDEIILNRNLLAHCRSKYEDDGTEVLVTQKGDKKYNSEDIHCLRKRILYYFNLFRDILLAIER